MLVNCYSTVFLIIIKGDATMMNNDKCEKKECQNKNCGCKCKENGKCKNNGKCQQND